VLILLVFGRKMLFSPPCVRLVNAILKKYLSHLVPNGTENANLANANSQSNP